MAGKTGHGMKRLGHGAAMAAKAVWSHVPLTDASKRKQAQFTAEAMGPAVGAAVQQVLQSTQTGQPPAPISPRKQIAQPGHDETATSGYFSKFNDEFLDTLRTGQSREPGDGGMQLLQVLSTPEFIDAIENGGRGVQVTDAIGTLRQETVSFRTPVEGPDTAYGVQIAARRQKLAAALRQGGRVENPDMLDLEIIYFACVGRDVVPDTRTSVWEGWSHGSVPNPRDAFFNFLEMEAQDPDVTEPGKYIGTVFRELAGKCSFDPDVDEIRRRLYGTEKEEIPMLLNPDIAKDYLTRRVAVGRFVRVFSDSARETLSGAADQLHTSSRVPGLGLGPAEAEPIVQRLSDGIRRDMLKATDREKFDVMLKRLERVQSSVLPQGASDLMSRIRSELKIRETLLGPAPDANERSEMKQAHAAVIGRLLDELDAIPVTGAVKTELCALVQRVRALHADESTDAQDRAAKAIDRFEHKIRYPLRAIAEQMLDLLEKSPARQARGELPLYERIIALNVYEGRCNAKPISLKKAWLRMLRFIKWGTENGWHAVVTWPVGLYLKYVANPVLSRLKHFQDAWREGLLFGNYGKLAAEYSLSLRDRLAFLRAYDAATDKPARVACARDFVAHYGSNDTKAELAAKWAAAVAAIRPCNPLTREVKRWNSYRRLRNEAMEADRELMRTKGEWLSHRRQGLTGVLFGEIAVGASVWAAVAGVDLARGRDEMIIAPRWCNPIHGEVFSGWKRQVINPRNWGYNFSNEGGEQVAQGTMRQDLPQDLADPHRFGSDELGALLGIGRTMTPKERARAVEWLQEENLEPSPWQQGERVPSALTYFDELRRGNRRITSIAHDKKSAGMPVMGVTRATVADEVSAGTNILDPSHTDAFVGLVKSLSEGAARAAPSQPESAEYKWERDNRGAHVTLAWLRQNEPEWARRGFVQRRMDAQYAQLGVHEKGNADFLFVNPVLSRQVAAWASLGAEPLHIAPCKPGENATNADRLVGYAIARIQAATGEGNMSEVCVETGDTAITVLRRFDVDSHLAEARKQNDAKQDEKRADFFISVKAYLEGPKNPADLSTLWNAVGSEERVRLLHDVVYAQIAEEAQAKGLLEEKLADHEAHKATAASARAGETFGLGAEDATFVAKKGNEDVKALLEKLTQPRTDYVIRTEALPQFVQDLRMHKEKSPGISAWDFDPTLEKPGRLSARAVRMGFIVDWGTRQAEQTAKATYQEKEDKLQELKKAEAEKEAKIEELKKSRITFDAKMKEKKAQLDALNKKDGKWDQKALLESQVNDLKGNIEQVDREIDALKGKPSAGEAGSQAAIKAKYAVNDAGARAAFWKANDKVQASVHTMAANLAKIAAVQAAMKRAGITDLEQHLLDHVYELATGTDADKAAQRKSFGMAVTAGAKGAAPAVKFDKGEDGLRKALVAKLQQLMPQK